MRTLVVGVGNLDAPSGSKDWAVAVRARIQVAIKDTSTDRESLQSWLRIMRKFEGYKALEDSRGRKFTRYEDFCIEKLPYGLGYSPADLDQIVQERKTAASVGADTLKKKRPRGNPNFRQKDAPIVSNVNNSEDRPAGNTQSAALRRLYKDRRDLYEKVVAEELTANAAMIEAGFRVKTITVPIDTPERAVKPLVDRFGAAKLHKAIDSWTS